MIKSQFYLTLSIVLDFPLVYGHVYTAFSAIGGAGFLFCVVAVMKLCINVRSVIEF